MFVFFHPDQLLHHPRTYFSRGMMRTPQEVPARALHILKAVTDIGLTAIVPDDHGMAPIAAVHGEKYLAFLRQAHTRWKEIPDDGGDEVMSNSNLWTRMQRHFSQALNLGTENDSRYFGLPTFAGRRIPCIGAGHRKP